VSREPKQEMYLIQHKEHCSRITIRKLSPAIKKVIRKAKRSSWRRYCKEISDVPSSARLMKIVAKQATSSVSINLPEGQYTQTGKETPKELFRVHFPDSKVIDVSYDDGQVQQSLGICRHIMNRGDLNLDKCVINQSKIRWALSTFKPFKPGGTDGFYQRFCSKGWNI
jgi:hypothetical protein